MIAQDSFGPELLIMDSACEKEPDWRPPERVGAFLCLFNRGRLVAVFLGFLSLLVALRFH